MRPAILQDQATAVDIEGAAPNSSCAIEGRLSAGRLSSRAVWLMVPARWAFAALTFGLAALFANVTSQPDPLSAAGAWWMVDGTLVDLACLAALMTLTRREGIGLLDLVAFDRRRAARDLLLGLVLLLALIPALVISQVLQSIFYLGQLPPQIALVHLPTWATVYSVLAWPTIWAFTEQATYLGYLFPRLEVLTRSKLVAAIVVIAFWSLQHTALPFVPDARYLAYRTLTTVPIAVTAVVLYVFVLRRRLLPLIVVHWLADALAALTPVLLAQPS